MTKLEGEITPSKIGERNRIYIIHGIGGIGKTELMLEFARLHKNEYTALFWLDGTSHDTITQSLVNAAARISKQLPQSNINSFYNAYKKASELNQSSSRADTQIPPALSPKESQGSLKSRNTSPQLAQLIASIYDWLSLTNNTGWLLLIDNVDRVWNPTIPDDQAYDINEFLPRADHGGIIITTRQERLCRIGRNDNIFGMKDGESLQLLAQILEVQVNGMHSSLSHSIPTLLTI
jgi:hypothetical protein